MKNAQSQCFQTKFENSIIVIIYTVADADISKFFSSIAGKIQKSFNNPKLFHWQHLIINVYDQIKYINCEGWNISFNPVILQSYCLVCYLQYNYMSCGDHSQVHNRYII